MRKVIITILLILFTLAAGANAQAATISGTVTLPDTVASEDGLDISLYFGYDGYAVCQPYTIPESAHTGYYEYDGVSVSVPEDTLKSIFKIGWMKKAQTNITVPYGDSSVDFSAETDSRYIDDVIYIIDDDMYIGHGKVSIPAYSDNNITISSASLEKRACFTGTITVPLSDTDTVCQVVAEENSTVEYNEDSDSYSRSYGFCAVKEITIPAGETTAEYSLGVRAYDDKNVDYTLYIVFKDKEYIRQYKTVSTAPGKYRVDFDSFEESPKITGTITLPDEVTELKTFNFNDVDSISGYVKIQSASAPYYFIDSYAFTLSNEERSIPFELTDDIGVDGVLLSYELSLNIRDIYSHGIYLDDTKCVANKSMATVIKPDNQSVELNIIKGNTVHIALDTIPEYATPVFDVLVQTDSDNLSGLSETVLAFRTVSSASDETIDYHFVLPEDYDSYVLNYVNSIVYPNTIYYENSNLFLTADGNLSDIRSSKIFSVSDDTTELTMTWHGYNPPLPVRLNRSISGSEDTVSVGISTRNLSDFDIENANVYLLIYDEDGLCDVISQDTGIIEARDSHHYISISVPKEQYNSAIKVEALCWDGMRALSEKFIVRE